MKSRMMRLIRYVKRAREMRNVFRMLVSKPKEKISLGRPRLRWEYNIKRHLQNSV
jgi:hypothetical protein